jgi:hypothetical protein
MGNISRVEAQLTRRMPKASEVLVDYGYWLKRRYGLTGTYLTNAKSFLRSYKQGGDVLSQLEDYISQRKTVLRSVLKRFYEFLKRKSIIYLINDLNEPKLPLGNIYVKIFLSSIQDRLKSKGSLSTYATVLNGYFDSIKDDVSRINKRTAGKYILAPTLSDYTKRLYKTVLKNFCEWGLSYQLIPNDELSKEQRMVRNSLKRISVQSLREIVGMRVILPRSLTSTYCTNPL